jgi:hypothetical protein
MSANGLHYFLRGGHDTEGRESSAINHNLSIDEHFVLGVMTVNHIDIDLQIPTQLRRRTDGVKAGESIRAVANGDSCHFSAREIEKLYNAD